MKAKRILNVLGSVDDQYIAEMYEEQKAEPPRRSVKKVWLIAAVIAVLLLLVGCAVVYAFRMQDLKVGEYSIYVPTAYDDKGNVIPVETREPTTLLSLQNVNIEALAEWLAFKDEYDKDGAIMTAADKAGKTGAPGSPWDLPQNYHLTYGCYSQEMVEKLDEIAEKYDLKLLSEYVVFDWWESRALLDSLAIDSLVYDDSGVEYWDGNLHLEGTFDLNMFITLDMGDWTWDRGYASYRYSAKEYFDPSTGGMKESQTYTQWDYTRKDGTTVLLVLNENTARIYADLPDAFISIYVDPVIWVDGKEVPMTQGALEQFAEMFDLSVKPQPTTMEVVEKYKAEAQAAYDAETAEKQTNHEALYVAGYEEFVYYRLENYPSPERLSYVLFDVNGDGVQELIIGGLDILSMKDEKSYKYFDLTETGVLPAQFRPCEGNVFAVHSESEFFKDHRYFFYQANEESAEFITGVTHDTNSDTWYRNLTDGMDTQQEQITAEEAQNILDAYTYVDFDWLPLKKYGQPVMSVNYTDPYAKYIANKLDRYENAVNYEYTLMDLNGDGIDELIARDVECSTNGEEYLLLSIHSVKDGEVWDMGINCFAYVCEGGILEDTLDFIDYGNDSDYHEFYLCTEDGAEPIERVMRDPVTLYWGHALAGQNGKTITAEKAKSILDSYKRIELDMKPFSEYPFK